MDDSPDRDHLHSGHNNRKINITTLTTHSYNSLAESMQIKICRGSAAVFVCGTTCPIYCDKLACRTKMLNFRRYLRYGK